MIKSECEYWASRHQLRVALVKNRVVGTFRRLHTSTFLNLNPGDREEIEEVLRTVRNGRLGFGCGDDEPLDYHMFDWKDGRVINKSRSREGLKIEFGTDLFGFGLPVS